MIHDTGCRLARVPAAWPLATHGRSDAPRVAKVGCRIPDAGCRMQDAGYWVYVYSYWLLVPLISVLAP